MSTPKKNYYEVQIPLGLMSKIAISQKKLIVNWPNLFAWLVCSIFARLFFKICTTLIIHYTYPWKYIVHGKTNRLLPNFANKGLSSKFLFLCFYNFFKKRHKGANFDCNTTCNTSIYSNKHRQTWHKSFVMI